MTRVMTRTSPSSTKAPPLQSGSLQWRRCLAWHPSNAAWAPRLRMSFRSLAKTVSNERPRDLLGQNSPKGGFGGKSLQVFDVRRFWPVCQYVLLLVLQDLKKTLLWIKKGWTRSSTLVMNASWSTASWTIFCSTSPRGRIFYSMFLPQVLPARTTGAPQGIWEWHGSLCSAGTCVASPSWRSSLVSNIRCYPDLISSTIGQAPVELLSAWMALHLLQTAILGSPGGLLLGTPRSISSVWALDSFFEMSPSPNGGRIHRSLCKQIHSLLDRPLLFTSQRHQSLMRLQTWEALLATSPSARRMRWLPPTERWLFARLIQDHPSKVDQLEVRHMKRTKT